MHYKNGRKAKPGDKVVSINNGIVVSGILHTLQEGATTCNGRIAQTNTNDPYVTLSDCIHVDDIEAKPIQKPEE